MTERQSVVNYVLTAILLLALFLVALFLEEKDRVAFIQEGGLIVFGYFLCVTYIIYKGKFAFIKQHGFFLILIIFFLMMELDFDKRFITMGIFKSRFYISNDVPFVQKSYRSDSFFISALCRFFNNSPLFKRILLWVEKPCGSSSRLVNNPYFFSCSQVPGWYSKKICGIWSRYS